MTERNIGMELDRARLNLVVMENWEWGWKSRWMHERAKLRLKLRAQTEMDGTARKSTDDVDAEVTVTMNDRMNPLGWAWVCYTLTRARRKLLGVKFKILDREHWAEVRRY